ncbi:YugN family protein [Gracilibacillus alcaliphilus]|uniref:YugN family protein n=1 Tax=Gracilibacillus alcaliphilus TaxID=1401441 RepID=UPI00195EE823|nr:hypothetical protein [Gracilibacillus alcaliphilus]
MYALNSTLTNQTYNYQAIKDFLEEQGFVLAGNWDYQQGYFDCKLANQDGYHFLRIPFETVNGEVEQPEAVVQLGSPFVLTHRYQDDVDQTADSGVLQASFNQFQTPVEKDGDIPKVYIEQAEQKLRLVEKTID